MSISINATYNDILKRRRDMRNISDIPSVMYYKTTINGYILYLNDRDTLMRCDLTNAEEVSDFEENIMPFCNKEDLPFGKMVLSHDFANNNSWVYGTIKSCYALLPLAGKEYKIKIIKGLVDNSAVFNDGALINPTSFIFHVVFWQALAASCPSFGNDKTLFGTPLYNPAGGVNTGWVKVYPTAADGDQRVDGWVYMLNHIPQYKVFDFYFSNANDMKLKSTFSIEGNAVSLQYDYSSHFVSMNLRSSKNERIEAYTSTDAEVQSPNSIKNIMCFGVLEYDEW